MTGQTVYSEMPVPSVITVTNRKYEKEKKAMTNYEIVKKIAVLGGKPDGVTKEINIVKWGVYDPIDVYKRQWVVTARNLLTKSLRKSMKSLKVHSPREIKFY